MSSFPFQRVPRAPRKVRPHVPKRLSLEALEDRTVLAPVITAVAPVNTGVGASAKVSATFSVAMNKATITSNTFQLKDSNGVLVAGAITYNNANFTATFDSNAELNYATTYTATVVGGLTGVADTNGTHLATNYTWSFTTVPAPQTGLGGPILVVTTTANPFSSYYAEILRAEGLNEFATLDLSQVNSTTLAPYGVVILGQTPLTSAQVTTFTNYVNGGGNLIAMRPDKQLANLLGLSDASATLSNAYLLINTTSGPGLGLTNQTIQFHDVADMYTLNGATSLARLYVNAIAATASPAVTVRSVGSGQAAAFTFDLAKSIVYTRQGNPAWSGQHRDANQVQGLLGGEGGGSVTRSDDLFFGNATLDPQPDWVDLNKVAIPQADEEQRLLANLIGQMESSKMPLPRFWYLPNGAKAMILMSGDDHNNGGTAGRWATYLANGNSGGRPIRGSSYLVGNPITDAQAASFTAQGFEVGMHPVIGTVDTSRDWTSFADLDNVYTTQLAQFGSSFPSVPSPSSVRTHWVIWSDYATQPQVEFNHRIRLDTNYYYWPPSWIQDRPGMFTGSGFPLRFTTASGNMIDTYQAVTQLTDESGQTYPFEVNALLDGATGANGYYGIFTVNAHTDSSSNPVSDAVVASAISYNVPVVSGRQVLDWIDGRNGSSFSNLSWNAAAGTLSFTVVAGATANGLQAMVPMQSAVGGLIGITKSGAAVSYTTQTIKGVQYAFFNSSGGDYVAQYPSTAPTNGGPFTIWSSSATPTSADSGDPTAVEVGVKFRSDQAGQISGIRFYKSATNTGVHVGNLWSSSGTLLASATFTSETASGWQQVNFSTPVSIQANTTYVASYHTNGGHYSEDDYYFTNSGVDNAPLHALKDGVDGGNGVYVYGSSSGFPNQAYLASNYWVDVVLNTSTTSAGPAVISKTPASAATNVATNTTVTATFDRSVVASTISFVLKDSSNNTVAATVSYNDGTHTATLTPNAPLANVTTYTATVSGAKDANGYVMSAPVTWSFSTAAASSGPFSIWSSSVTPTNLDSGDPNAVELGVKFRSDVAGQISGILFYKSSANIGTHVGNLWSSTGTLLASATFTSETYSGWQQVNFSTPVSIQANTTYVASYHTNVGHFSYDRNYFATSGVDNAPLHALKNGVDGGNGVFLYGLLSGFPNQSYLSSNYWVDVVLIQTGGGASPPSPGGAWLLSLRGDNSPLLSSDVILGNSLSPGSVTIPVTPPHPNGTWLGAGGGPVEGNFSTVGSGPIDGGTDVLDAIFIQMTKADTATSTRSEALPDGFTDPLGREGWLA